MSTLAIRLAAVVFCAAFWTAVAAATLAVAGA